MFQKNSLLIFLVLIVNSSVVWAQNPGDTIVVQSLSFSSTTRDTIVQFPNLPNMSFEKVLMEYSLRCKNANVSTTSNRNLGCGEWDYSCNTYLHDSAHVDSLEKVFPSHIISGFSGSVFDYTSQATFDFYQNFQQNVILDSIISDTASMIGTGNLGLSKVLATDAHGSKSQYLFTQSELIAAGVSAGNIDAISFTVNANPNQAKLFRLKMKSSTKTVLNAVQPELNGFTEVYFHNSHFVNGLNRIQFKSPFYWDGVSNIILEASFTNKTVSNALNFEGSTGASAIHSKGDNKFEFNGSNYLENLSYKGVQGSGSRTIETWINTQSVAGGEEIVSWGSNATGQKWLIRLNNVGRVRVEINGGNSIGTTAVDDGQWHHIAVVSDGSNSTNIKIYIDGQLDAISASLALAINTTNSTNFKIGRGHHSKNFKGNIAEIRVWDTELNASEIQNWMHRPIDNSHPKFSNLNLYYPLNEGNGNSVLDQSGNNHNATVINWANWNQIYGNDHFKNFEILSERPNITVHQGQYNLNIVTDTIIDSLMRPVHQVEEYAVFSKAGTVEDDSLGVINSTLYWEAGVQNVYAPNGTVVSSINAPSQGQISITDLPYYQRDPSKFEILSFVTPYGIGVDFGQEGETWTFDLSDFTPILNGKKRLTIERGGQWQEEMDIKFLMIVGTPPRDVLDIQQIWKVEKKSFSSINTDASFEPRNVLTHSQGQFYKIRTAITGHGQEGEFIPRTHWVNVGGGNPEFSWQVWKECALNPLYPQGGTWIYDRAGWCPGMLTDVEEWDISQEVSPGQMIEIDYGINTASGTSDYIVNHQLVSYGAANHALDAKLVNIISPSNEIQFGRIGKICEGVEIVIQNTGSSSLSSLKIDYWVNNASTPQTYQWTGNLGFMETEKVVLPSSLALWDALNGNDDVVHVAISSPNGGSDEYSFNNELHGSFSIPDIMPQDFLIDLRTNLLAVQNSYKITDESGNIRFSKSGFSNNTLYRDTISLPIGCYTFELTDAGDNGISFWANNEGNGSLVFRMLSRQSIKVFEPDFGKSIVFPFTVVAPLTENERETKLESKLYPNPARDQFILELKDIKSVEVKAFNSIGQEMKMLRQNQEDKAIFNTKEWTKGVYFIHLVKDGKVEVEKLNLI